MAVTRNYTAYSEQEVFERDELNVFCNVLLSRIFRKFNSDFLIDESFLLTGKAARIVQGEGVSEINTISFITDRNEIFLYLKENLSDLFPQSRTLAYSDHIRVETLNFKMEIWIDSPFRRVVEVNNVFCQDATDIPNYIENYV